MFSNNNRISTRQVFRLFVFDFVGESTLILPSQLAAFAGNDGLASIVLGGIMGSLYLWYLAYVLKKMETDLVTYMERILPTWMKKIFLVLLLVYFTGMAGYGAYIFSDVIQKGLIAGEPFPLILILVLLTAGYAVCGGIESRARVYEILFVVLFVLLAIMLLIAAGDLEMEYLYGFFQADTGSVMKGSLAVFLQQAAYFMESELAFSIADRYIYIQDATEGYDYTIYDSDFTELDGGVYDNPENSIYETLDKIVKDLRMQPDTDRIKGEITEGSQLIPVNLEEFEEALERSHYVPPEVTYTVAECGEFHGMGRYRDDIKDVQEAIALWKEFQDSSLNGIPSIGILVHTPGQTDLEDEQLDLLSGQKIDLDMMQYYPVICKEEAAIEKICELIENLPEVGIIGKVPERISTELLLRELDQGKNIFSDNEKSLIREYGSQMKDDKKTRELAESICYQEEYGNQDVAPAVLQAKEEMREKRLTPHTTSHKI